MLRDVAESARETEAYHEQQAQTAVNLAAVCALIAQTLDIAAGMLDPARSNTVADGTCATVLASAIEEMRSRSETAKANEDWKAFDLFSDAHLVLIGAQERSRNNLSYTNGQ
jgi:hypothetical protein